MSQRIETSRSYRLRQAIRLVEDLEDGGDIPRSDASALKEVLKFVLENTDNNNKILLTQDTINELDSTEIP
jgi:hypothetical protein